MPRWPSQVETPELTPSPAAPPAPPAPPKQEYGYQALNPDDADTRTYPYNGETVRVSNSPDNPGFEAKWRATRQLKGWKWVKTGAWVVPLYNIRLPFEPLYWRPLSNLEDSEN